MDLTTADAAFNTLVGVISSQDNTLNRVEPNQPANSYLVHKIQGISPFGTAMPPPNGMLPAAEIAAIEQWIMDGATRN
jgi:hypothetical protein